MRCIDQRSRGVLKLWDEPWPAADASDSEKSRDGNAGMSTSSETPSCPLLLYFSLLSIDNRLDCARSDGRSAVRFQPGSESGRYPARLSGI